MDPIIRFHFADEKVEVKRSNLPKVIQLLGESKNLKSEVMVRVNHFCETKVQIMVLCQDGILDPMPIPKSRSESNFPIDRSTTLDLKRSTTWQTFTEHLSLPNKALSIEGLTPACEEDSLLRKRRHVTSEHEGKEQLRKWET